MSEKRRALEVNKVIGGAIRKHYQDVQQNRPLAYALLAPDPMIELCYAAGIQPAFPENYACVCAARKVSGRFCEVAENNLLLPDLCSYMRTAVGSWFAREVEKLPMGGLPEPDLLVYTTSACVTYYKWWDLYKFYFNKPLIYVNTPRIMDEIEDYYIDFTMKEIQRAIGELEKLLGKKIPEENIAEVVKYSDQLVEYWHKMLELQKTVPAPAGLNDISNILFLLVALPGTKEAVDIAKQAYEEMKERADKKIGNVSDERHRLMWLNIPMWYNLGLTNYFEDRGCAIPISDYTNYIWGVPRLDRPDPIESLAIKALKGELNESVEYYIDWMLRDIKEYKLDGVVIHSNRSCKVLSVGLLDAAKIVRETYDIPVLIIESDHTDDRAYSDAEVKTRIDAFIESLG